jgi:hypothetical protein
MTCLRVGGADARLHRLDVVLQRSALQLKLLHVTLVRPLRLVQRARPRLGGAQLRLCLAKRRLVARKRSLLRLRLRVQLRKTQQATNTIGAK